MNPLTGSAEGSKETRLLLRVLLCLASPNRNQGSFRCPFNTKTRFFEQLAKLPSAGVVKHRVPCPGAAQSALSFSGKSFCQSSRHVEVKLVQHQGGEHEPQEEKLFGRENPKIHPHYLGMICGPFLSGLPYKNKPLE